MSYSQKPPKNKLSMVKQKRIQTLKIYCVTNMIEELQGCGFLLAKGYWVKVTPIFIIVFEGRNKCYCYYYCIWFAWNIDVKGFANYLLFKMLRYKCDLSLKKILFELISIYYLMHKTELSSREEQEPIGNFENWIKNG